MGSGTTLLHSDVSDIGLRRHKNQDSRVVLAPWSRDQFRRTGWLFVVADGMGAHAAGETASDLAVKTVPQAYQRLASRSPPLAMESSIRQANDVIYQQGEATAELRGMGTTCTALALLPRGALVGHVGDSRAYRIRGDVIEQLSQDHSLAWEVEASFQTRGGGPIPSTPKNIITRSLGPHPHVKVDLEGPFPVEEGDTFVVCSDGLSGQVADEEIGLMAGSLPPAEAVASLLGLALVRGAPDNVTLIVARAGRDEATGAAVGDPPWPLNPDTIMADTAKPFPSGWLAMAAGSLLGGLIAATFVNDFGGWAIAVLGVLALAFLAAIVLAVSRLLPAGEAASLVLQAGKQLGNGPYRSADCKPSPALLEGIISSVESAADGLGDEERHECLEQVGAARSAARNGDHAASLAAANRGIAIYRRAVEAARRDDTHTLSDG